MHSWLDTLAAVISLSDFALIGAAAFAGGFIRGFVGFGGAVLLILAMSAIIGPREAVAIAALAGLPPMLQLLPAAIRSGERSFAIPFGLASFIGAPLGTWMLVSIAPEVMKIAIAVFVLFTVAVLGRGGGISIGIEPLGARERRRRCRLDSGHRWRWRTTDRRHHPRPRWRGRTTTGRMSLPRSRRSISARLCRCGGMACSRARW